MAKQILKSIGAIVAGFFTTALLSVGTDFLLESQGIFPPISEGLFITWMLALALTYRIVYTVLGSYVVARLAPYNPLRHVVILGSIGLVFSVIGTVVMWDKSTAWYPIALIVSTVPCMWAGYVISQKK